MPEPQQEPLEIAQNSTNESGTDRQGEGTGRREVLKAGLYTAPALLALFASERALATSDVLPPPS